MPVCDHQAGGAAAPGQGSGAAVSPAAVIDRALGLTECINLRGDIVLKKIVKALLFTFALATVPEPFATVQAWTGELGWVATVTA